MKGKEVQRIERTVVGRYQLIGNQGIEMISLRKAMMDKPRYGDDISLSFSTRHE